MTTERKKYRVWINGKVVSDWIEYDPSTNLSPPFEFGIQPGETYTLTTQFEGQPDSLFNRSHEPETETFRAVYVNDAGEVRANFYRGVKPHAYRAAMGIIGGLAEVVSEVSDVRMPPYSYATEEPYGMLELNESPSDLSEKAASKFSMSIIGQSIKTLMPRKPKP